MDFSVPDRFLCAEQLFYFDLSSELKITRRNSSFYFDLASELKITERNGSFNFEFVRYGCVCLVAHGAVLADAIGF
jgi:hypothetical protein